MYDWKINPLVLWVTDVFLCSLAAMIRSSFISIFCVPLFFLSVLRSPSCWMMRDVRQNAKSCLKMETRVLPPLTRHNTHRLMTHLQPGKTWLGLVLTTGKVIFIYFLGRCKQGRTTFFMSCDVHLWWIFSELHVTFTSDGLSLSSVSPSKVKLTVYRSLPGVSGRQTEKVVVSTLK